MIILGAFLALGGALFVALLVLYGSYVSNLPDPTGLESFRLDEGSRVISADGVELASFAAERRDVVNLDDIPQVLIDAQVAAEDQTFWTNPCIDFRGILRAALQNFQAGERVSGASTICQQLVRIRLIDADLMADPDRIVERKIKEALLAFRIEQAFSRSVSLAALSRTSPNSRASARKASNRKSGASATESGSKASSGAASRRIVSEPAVASIAGNARTQGARVPLPEGTGRRLQAGRLDGHLVGLVDAGDRCRRSNAASTNAAARSASVGWPPNR